MIRAPTDPAARAATTSRRLDARLDDAQIIAHAKSSNAAPLDANTRKFPLGFPFGFSRLGFRAYPITRDRAVIDGSRASTLRARRFRASRSMR